MITDNQPMTLLAHLIELRRRLIISLLAFCASFVLCYSFSEQIFDFLVRPLADLHPQGSTRRMIYTSLTEAFVTYIKVAMFGALFLSFPVIASQVWIFIAPALYRNERCIFLPFLIATPLLFILGAALAYYIVFPMAWSFFVSFETSGGPHSLPIQLEAKVNEYLSTVMQIIFAFGLCFQLPVLLSLLGRAGVVSAHALAQRRKYAFLGIVVVAALLTPPDLLSPFGLIVPIYGLYELSILLVRWFEKRKAFHAEEKP